MTCLNEVCYDYLTRQLSLSSFAKREKLEFRRSSVVFVGLVRRIGVRMTIHDTFVYLLV